jgi:ADP-heptose:LPS heptosyltransferase
MKLGLPLDIRRRLLGRKAEAELAPSLLGLADAARDDNRWRDAAALYGEALRLDPENGPIHVQAGHMFKEAGDLERAERHYLAALRLRPADPDLALQLGHFRKISGRLREAELEYARALSLKPGWVEPAHELEFLRQTGRRGGIPTAAEAVRPDEATSPLERLSQVDALTRSGAYDHLAPEVMPRTPAELLHRNGESIHLRRLGRKDRSRWGVQTTLRGVEAIRGFCISREPIVEMQILLNGLTIWRGPTRPYPLANEREDFALRKNVFNVWLDFSSFAPGRYHIELRFRDLDDMPDPEGGRRSHRELVVIDEPLPEPLFEGGDAWTPVTDPDDPRSVEEQVNARPSIISPAVRSLFKSPPKNILVLRTDQLGDVVISVPAMLRLRELFPEARLVAVLTPANADLVRTLQVFDEIIVVEFPDEKVIQRKRVMTPEDQEALRHRLAAYNFDLALDLAPAVESRPLLLLSGAPFLAGMRDKQWPYITAGFDLNTYDPIGRSDMMPASCKTLAFVESLNTMMNSPARILRRPELTRDRLAKFGIADEENYVVLHTGARVVFSRWGHYMALAERVLERTPYKLIILSDDPNTRSQLTPGLRSSDRCQLLDQRLDFDDFDAILSFCTVFVGNDSGPKHLASLRGSNVVSLHTPRINWGEWGQEQTGSIIHRRVPCAGCHIYHEPEECGKDYICVTSISLEEVWGAMQPFLSLSSEAAVKSLLST